MPWLRSGDNAATHPIVMRVVSLVRAVTDVVLERDVAVNEVFGFVTRCALQSAGHTTDYVIDEGTAQMLGGVRTDRLLELAVKAGYLSRKRGRGLVTYRLVDDPEFLHMRLRAEIDRERQRKADAANRPLVASVRLRDGDECRYCGVIVNWRDRKGSRGGTYDHRNLLETVTTVEDLVVACNGCNAGRGDDPAADERYPLRPAPPDPYYSQLTADLLVKAGHRVAASEDLRPRSQRDTAQRPGSQPDTAPAARTGVRRTEHSAHRPRAPDPPGDTSADASTDRRPGHQPDTAPPATGGQSSTRTARPDPDLQIQQISSMPNLDLPGRDGTGGAGSCSDPGDGSARRRRRRSPRGQNQTRAEGEL